MNVNKIFGAFFGLIIAMIVGILCVAVVPQLAGCDDDQAATTSPSGTGGFQLPFELDFDGFEFDPIGGLLSLIGLGGEDDLVNAAIDATGIKTAIDEGLHDQASTIARSTGLPQSTVDAAIDSLAVSDWRATTLPDDAKATSSFDASYDGTAATITTYDDPRYVGVTVAGQNVTFQVPDSATSSISLLKYL